MGGCCPVGTRLSPGHTWTPASAPRATSSLKELPLSHLRGWHRWGETPSAPRSSPALGKPGQHSWEHSMASVTPVSDELGEVVGRCWHCPRGWQGLFSCWACPLCWPQRGQRSSQGGQRRMGAFPGRGRGCLPLLKAGSRFCTSWLGSPRQGAEPCNPCWERDIYEAWVSYCCFVLP